METLTNFLKAKKYTCEVIKSGPDEYEMVVDRKEYSFESLEIKRFESVIECVFPNVKAIIAVYTGSHLKNPVFGCNINFKWYTNETYFDDYLPVEMVVEIVKYLNLMDLLHFNAVSLRMRKILTKSVIAALLT